MPIVEKGSKVLVTGANGFLGIKLLEEGYSVRGAVRSREKGEFLSRYFEKYEKAARFEFVVIPDIMLEGAFDEAVNDVDAIEHAASPFTLDIASPEDLIAPAVKGTAAILQSALKSATRLNRIVVTSSTVTAYASPDKPTIYTEEDCNTASIEDYQQLGEKTPPFTVYCVAKTLAEKGRAATWDFYNEHKALLSWDMVVLNPPLIFGPPIQDAESPSKLNTSLIYWYDAVVRGGGSYKTKETLAWSNSYVDVRDAALGHVLALQKENAAGERIFTSAGGFIWQEWLSTANALPESPLKATSPKLQQGFPEILEENFDRVTLAAFDQRTTNSGDQVSNDGGDDQGYLLLKSFLDEVGRLL